MVDRKSGYYWVKVRDGDDWEVAYFVEDDPGLGHWLVIGDEDNDAMIEDDHLHEIGPLIEPPK